LAVSLPWNVGTTQHSDWCSAPSRAWLSLRRLSLNSQLLSKIRWTSTKAFSKSGEKCTKCG
jgi:hypothetical protein